MHDNKIRGQSMSNAKHNSDLIINSISVYLRSVYKINIFPSRQKRQICLVHFSNGITLQKKIFSHHR